MTWQLIAYPEQDLRSLLTNGVRTTLKAQRRTVRAVEAYDLAGTRQAIEENGFAGCELVVVGSTMPSDAAASIGQADREPTQQFIRSLKRQWARLPVIVVSKTPDERLKGFLDAFDQTELLAVGDIHARLADALGELLGGQTRRSQACVLLDIDLHSKTSANWHTRRLDQPKVETSGVLHIDEQRLQRLLREADRLDRDIEGRNGNWLQSLDDLSSDLSQLLFAGGGENLACWQAFKQYRDSAGGMGNTRIRFAVNGQTQRLPVEALRDWSPSGSTAREPAGESASPASASGDARASDYWILRAPLYRRHPGQSRHQPLFKDQLSRDGQIDCLVIQADTERGGTIVGTRKPVHFPPLPACTAEAREVESLLSKTANAEVNGFRATPGRVLRLDFGDDDPEDPAERLLRTLAEGRWHLVHFCGHVDTESSDRPALVLSADRKSLLPISRLGAALKDTQFLFLGGCRSGANKAVLQVVERDVPAVLGFQWPIDDDLAGEFALSFYEQLFNRAAGSHRYLEYAFLKARKQAHERAQQRAQERKRARDRAQGPDQVDSDGPSDEASLDTSWISPVLVMQMTA